MNRGVYLENLHRLRRAIKNPTTADVAAIAPHLDERQLEQVFRREMGGVLYFAIPPIRVKYGYLVASRWEREGDQYLDLAYASRTPESYADSRSHGSVFSRTAFQPEAMHYAEEHWGDQLILDTWVDYGEVCIQDPTVLFRDRPTTKSTVYYTLDRDANALLNDGSAPSSEVWNNALVTITTDLIEGMELRGGRGGHVDFNCANCSYGLSLVGCDNCGFEFRDDGVRTGHTTPLPMRIVTLLQKRGHAFGMDPATARKREQQDWEIRARSISQSAAAR